jgi:glucuronoarabinoxylan endo-1,4-beta-xylanase
MKKNAFESLEQRRLLANAVADFGQTHQTIDGFGAAMISWAWRPEYGNPAFYNQLVGDLGATLTRAAVWPSFEIENDDNDPNHFNWSAYSSANIAYNMKFYQELKKRDPSSKFMFSVWTPPYWMKTNQSIDLGGQLRADMRAEFAEYLAAFVIAAKRDFDIDIDAIGIQNEPIFVEYYESAVYDNVDIRETLFAAQQKFDREGLKTRLLINEDLGMVDTNRWRWINEPTLADVGIDKNKVIVGSHWTDPVGMPLQANQIQGTGAPIWYTEISGANGDWPGAMATARELSDTLTRANSSAYAYWQYSDRAGAVTSALMDTGTPNPKYWALRHYYRWVRPGMERVETTSDNADAYLSAFRHPTSGDTTFVLLNNATTETTYTINVSGSDVPSTFTRFQSADGSYAQQLGNVSRVGNTLTVTLPAKSIVTLFNGTEISMPTQTTALPETWPINPPDSVQGFQLADSAMHGDAATVNQLIVGGANVNAASATGWTALHAAAAGALNGAEQAMSSLIAAGANVNAVTNEGFTPLHSIAMNQQARWGTDIDQKKRMAQLLINAGANVNAVDNQGRTPLMWAAITFKLNGEPWQDPSVMNTLLSNGANKNLLDNAGMSAYDYAVREHDTLDRDILAGPNTQRPTLRSGTFNFNTIPLLDFTISEEVAGTLSASDVSVQNLTTGSTLAAASMTFADWDSWGITSARLQLPSGLADGNYRLTIGANTIADRNGLSNNTAYTHDFRFLRGDLDLNGTIDFADLLTVVQNYNQGGTYAKGDLNIDGTVDFADLLMVVQKYGQSLSFGGPEPTTRKRVTVLSDE